MHSQEPAASYRDGGLLAARPGPRIRLDLSYDGAAFSGWAVQPGRRTVQGSLEESLAILLRRPLRLTVAGRTDAGVHARGQVCHFDLTDAEWDGLNRGRDIAPETALMRRLRGVLNKVLTRGTVENPRPHRPDLAGAIEVHSAVVAAAGFDARFSALWRRYSYRIADHPLLFSPLDRKLTLWHRSVLDVGLLNTAAGPLLGDQDFRAFCKPRAGATTIRELQRFEFERGPDGIITAIVQADAFCHNMVRSLVGAALLPGSGEREPVWLHRRLLDRRRDSQAKMAPAHPLVLEEVRYPSDAQLADRAAATRAVRAPLDRSG